MRDKNQQEEALKAAVREIDEVLIKHDVAYAVCLKAETVGFSRTFATPTWSKLRKEGELLILEGDGQEISSTLGIYQSFMLAGNKFAENGEYWLKKLMPHLPDFKLTTRERGKVDFEEGGAK